MALFIRLRLALFIRLDMALFARLIIGPFHPALTLVQRGPLRH